MAIDFKPKPKAISLFSGAGGCSFGFKKAGFDILYAQDIDINCASTYRKNFPDTITEVADINECDFNKIMEDIGVDKYGLDVLIGGPPCQGFSTAGLRFWDDPRNSLLKNYVKALSIIMPKWFIMENVEGLLTSNKGSYVFEAVKSFLDLGYNVRIDKIYSQEYGIPQRRKRVFIIGSLNVHSFELPKVTHPATGQIYRNGGLSVIEAISGLPTPSSNSSQTIFYSNDPVNSFDRAMRNQEGFVTDHYIPKLNPLDVAKFSLLKSGQTMKDLPEELQHESFKKRAYRRVKDGTPTEKRGGAPSGLKRLFPDEPCLTITSASTREFIHPYEDRPLTIRECARIQTFPDSFIFCGSAGQKIQQIANAIPPNIAEIFAKHILMYTNKICKAHTIRGRLFAANLTKASAKSPALDHTEKLLFSLMQTERQLKLGVF
jgi:DNA (cytosine-5)-methyltransferase 1